MTRRGFGLIETLITLSLSVFFIAGTGQLLFQSLRLHQKCEDEARTVRAASSFLEYLRSLPFDLEELEEGDHEDWVTEPGTAQRLRRRWRVADISPEAKQVEIEVSLEGGRSRSLRLLLHISKDLGF
jgi:hypothetical protein